MDISDKIIAFATISLDNTCKIYDEDSRGSHVEAILKVTESLKMEVSGCVVGAFIISYMESLNHTRADEDVMNTFVELYRSVEDVSEDIRELERQIEWDATKIGYGEVVNVIKLAAQYCAMMRGTKDGNYSILDRLKMATNVIEDPRILRKGYADALGEVCQEQRLVKALLALYEGLTGKGEFRRDILNSTFDQFEGDMIKVEKLCCRLLQLFFTGLCVLMTYEQLVRGVYFADHLESNIFHKKKHDIAAVIEQILQIQKLPDAKTEESDPDKFRSSMTMVFK